MINLKLFWIFFVIGTFTLGGGPAMIPVVRDKVVIKENLITEDDFIDIIALSSGLPGAIIINIATFTGNKIAGFSGALASALGALFPAYISIILLSAIFEILSGIKVINYIFLGIRPTVIVLLGISIYQIAIKTYTDKKKILAGIFIFSFMLLFDISSVMVIAGLILYGIISHFAKGNKNVV